MVISMNTSSSDTVFEKKVSLNNQQICTVVIYFYDDLSGRCLYTVFFEDFALQTSCFYY
jgi:hypothetical protein